MNPPPGYPGGPFPGMPPHMGMPPMGYPGAPPMGYPMGMPPPGYPYGVPMARPPYMGAQPPYPMGVPGMPPVMPGMPPVHVALPPGPAGAPPYVPPTGALPIRIGAAISAPPRLIGVETTVYVGRIPASATDDFIESLLQQCGKVANWKRMMDPISNTPRPFGFARFENEEGALRALRLLSNLEIDGNQLLLNVDDRTREALDRYQKSKAAIANIKEQQRQQRQQQLQEQQQKEQHEQQQQSADGDASAPDGDKPADEPAAAAAVAEQPSEEPAAEKEEEDVPDEVIVAKIKALLSDKKAGDFLKGMETSSAEDGDNAEATKREEERQASSSWDKELERERREREKDRAREREKRRGEREREARKRERDEREYREMEKDWETREREKERLRERREREEKKEREWQIEKELNYDEEEDRKRRKAGKRRKEREREEQDDEEDRRREVEEERARIEEERRRHEEELRRQEEEAEAYRNSVASEAEEQRAGVKRTYDASLADDTENGLTPISPDSSDQRVKLGLRIAAPTLLKKPTKLGVTPGFNPDEEQNPLTNPKRKKLVPLEPMRTEEQIKKEREEEAKQIVAMIPASKADLFNFQLSWDIVDEAEIVQKKMKPWVTKKIVEYLGEEEATLIEFVLAKMSNHMAPQEILDQLAFVLEDEAEVFVIKLWRMLIFEMIRAQKAKERGVNIAA